MTDIWLPRMYLMAEVALLIVEFIRRKLLLQLSDALRRHLLHREAPGYFSQ